MGWSRGPEIEQIDWAKAIIQAEKLGGLMATYGAANDGDARGVVDAIRGFAADSHDHEYFQVLHEGLVVGMMVIDPQKSHEIGALWIEWLVMHPGTQGGGRTLIEEAIRISEERGYGGRLELVSLPDAVGFYQTMGFVEQGHGGAMRFDPSPGAGGSGAGGKTGAARGAGSGAKHGRGR